VERCASTVEGGHKSASSILLRVFECVASGLLLEGTVNISFALRSGFSVRVLRKIVDFLCCNSYSNNNNGFED